MLPGGALSIAITQCSRLAGRQRDRIGERRIRSIWSDEVGDRLIGEDCVSSSNRCLAVLKRIPGEPNARLKVLPVSLIDGRQAVVDPHQRVVAQVDKQRNDRSVRWETSTSRNANQARA